MLTHLMMLKFKDRFGGRSKIENLTMTRDRINNLLNIFPELYKAKVYTDPQVTPGNFDMLIVSKHPNRSKLKVFLNQAENFAEKEKIVDLISDRVQLSYENIN